MYFPNLVFYVNTVPTDPFLKCVVQADLRKLDKPRASCIAILGWNWPMQCPRRIFSKGMFMADNKTLTQITSEAEIMINQMLESGGEIDEALDIALEMNATQLRDKLDAYGFVIDGLKSRRDYAMNRLKQWEQVASACEKSVENISDRIKQALQRLDTQDIHGFEYTFKLQANPPSVVIEDDSLVPGEFITTETKTETKISKRDILDAIKDGRHVPGVRIERKTKLVTKVSQRKSLETKNAMELVR